MARLPYITAIILVFFLIIITLGDGFTELQDRQMIRITAKLSLILFLLAFSASALQKLFNTKLTLLLLRNRRYLGLSFAVSHTFHLLFIVLLQLYFDAHNFDERGWLTVSGGAIAYVFLYLMSFTSTDMMVSKMGTVKWKLLHTIGSYYIIAVFSVSYLPRAWSDPNYIPFAAFIVMTLILRGISRFKAIDNKII